MNKQIKKFSICIALLFFTSSQPAHAGFWSNFTLPTCVISTAKKWALPALGLSACASILAYYFYNRTEPQTSTNKDTSTRPHFLSSTSPSPISASPTPGNPIDVQQILVDRQQDNSTCGYRVVHNSFLLLNNLAGNNHVFNPEFNDSDLFETFYQRRRLFITNESRKLGKITELNYWNTHCPQEIKKLNLSDQEKIQLLNAVTIDTFKTHNDNLILEYSRDNTIQKTITALNTKLSTATTNFDTVLAEINAVKIGWIKRKLNSYGINMPDNSELLLMLLEQPYSFAHLYGHWLDGQEITQLVSHIDPSKANEISILGSAEELPIIASTIKTKWQEDTNYTHLFIIGTMNASNGIQIAGHWFIVAAHKHEGIKTVYILDSFNTDRTENDPTVKAVVSFLESQHSLF